MHRALQTSLRTDRPHPSTDPRTNPHSYPHSLLCQKLCELTDVSPKEKHFFLLWNHFMQANPILSQIQLPAQTLAFVREHGATLAEHGLEEQWTAHLTNLWYEGVLGRDRVVECMDLYNNTCASLQLLAQNNNPGGTLLLLPVTTIQLYLRE